MIRLFDHRFDEFAADSHENLAPRAAVAVGAGLVALLVMPWRLCAVWTVTTLSIELWGWFAGRPQYLRQPVSFGDKLGFTAYLACLIAAWFCLAFAFWRTETLDGALCAMIIWISIVGFAQTFGSRTPLGFAICGVLPALGVLAVVVAGPGFEALRKGPVLGIMALAAAFAIAGARQTFAAGRRHEATQKALTESEADYRMLADNLTDVIGRIGLDSKWHYVSPSIQAQLGYTPAEFMRLILGDFIHSEDLPLVRGAFAELVSNGGTATVQYRHLHKSGQVVWVETSMSLLRDPETAAPLDVICVCREIGARKALERQLVDARERAEAGAAAKADFLANMTHELRTPLNAIVGFSDILKDSHDLVERDARHARLISEASATLLVVVNDVLDFSKLESGALELDPQPFDPLAMARSVAMLVEDQAAARGLTLEVIGQGEGGRLHGDGARLRQVVLNLISNALKFTSHGGVTVTVAQSAGDGGQRRLRVAVRDTGIGIAEGQLDAIFERFNQADVSVSRRFGGTGLGLAICRRIVGLMGGRIGVESQPGQGSTFWFELELPDAPEAAAPAPADAGAAELERPVRLLLVEDVDVNRELVRVMLAPFAVEIDAAVNGAEAVEAVAHADYDLVLMDVQMPVMDGLTATRQIRAQPCARHVPIIAMTANVLPEQVARCLEAGMDGHLGKPIKPAALLETIARWSAAGGEAQGRQTDVA